ETTLTLLISYHIKSHCIQRSRFGMRIDPANTLNRQSRLDHRIVVTTGSLILTLFVLCELTHFVNRYERRDNHLIAAEAFIGLNQDSQPGALTVAWCGAKPDLSCQNVAALFATNLFRVHPHLITLALLNTSAAWPVLLNDDHRFFAVRQIRIDSRHSFRLTSQFHRVSKHITVLSHQHMGCHIATLLIRVAPHANNAVVI